MTKDYNCIACTVGLKNTWVWDQVDTLSKNPNGVVDVADFDDFYELQGYRVVDDIQDAKVALFTQKAEPTHAAIRVDGNWWESKLGAGPRIVHRLGELEGITYGEVIRYYGE